MPGDDQSVDEVRAVESGADEGGVSAPIDDEAAADEPNVSTSVEDDVAVEVGAVEAGSDEGGGDAGEGVPDERASATVAAAPIEVVADAPGRTSVRYAVRVRDAEGHSVSEIFTDVEEAHGRFAELAEEHTTERVSLYGPGGALLRRRPANPERCAFCDEPPSGAFPVTALGSDAGTRHRDVLALCPEHHAAVTGMDGGLAFGPWRWHPGHSMT